MAVAAEGLVDRIRREFPDTWDYSRAESYNRQWLDALCQGFVSMWSAGVMTPGTGPPPAGTYNHTHVLSILQPSLMATPPKALFKGRDGLTHVFVDVITATVSAFLVASITMDVQEGSSPHVHGFSSFGSASDLSGQLQSALASTGRFNVQASVMPQWFAGFSAGLLGHLRDDAEMSAAAGAGHVHTLL